MPTGRRTVRSTRQHAGNFVDSTWTRNLGRTCQRDLGTLAINNVLFHDHVMIGNSCHLSQVGDDEDLMRLSEA
jgi:hypothetical protein